MEGTEEWKGPRLGDSASLWNFTPSPGWTKVEAAILRLLLMKHGVGRWVQIIDSGLLPGKMIQQLNGQTQRLLGQQSLAAYTGLQVDLDRIRADNDARQGPGVERKSGLIIWSGPNPTKEMKTQWQIEAQQKYGLTEHQKGEAERQLEEVAATLQRSKEVSQPPVDSIMLIDAAKLSRQELLLLLQKLRAKLKLVHARALLPPQKATGAAAQPLQDVSNGRQRQQSAGGKGGNSSRGSSGAKRSRTGSVKRTKGSGEPKSKASARGRRKQQGDLDEAPLNDAAAEVRAAAYDCDVAHLVGMGFEAHKAREALDETNCDPEAAVEWLLANCV